MLIISDFALKIYPKYSWLFLQRDVKVQAMKLALTVLSRGWYIILMRCFFVNLSFMNLISAIIHIMNLIICEKVNIKLLQVLFMTQYTNNVL